MEGRKDHYRVGASLSIAEFFSVANAHLDGSKSDLDNSDHTLKGKRKPNCIYSVRRKTGSFLILIESSITTVGCQVLSGQIIAGCIVPWESLIKAGQGFALASLLFGCLSPVPHSRKKNRTIGC